jgi:subtilisin family serine protease
MRATILRASVLGFTTLAIVHSVEAQDVPDISGLEISGGPIATDAVPAGMRAFQNVQVVVQLASPSLAAAQGPDAKRVGFRLGASQQRQYTLALGQEQDALAAQIRNLGGRETGRMNKALNAIVVEIDASRIAELRELAGVAKVGPLRDYELALSDTVPHIGAAAVQAQGLDGTGIRVAVLDSGIDYTHQFFGGPGTIAAYQAAYGTSVTDPLNTTTDGLFPTAKVVGGYDFVGERWPGTTAAPQPIAPDPDPIDCGPGTIALPCAGGHGTHVADIIGGNDGASHKGVAPGVSLYAVKVCSAVATSCNGLALLQGMEFALDPNGDGDISDAVDIINMSLGLSYGQIQDDLSDASSVASALGVVVVAAAGNAGDRPYIVSSPSTSPATISVAQTQVPSAVQDFMRIVSPAPTRDFLAVFQPWSAPLTAAIEAPVQYGDGAGANLNGCAAFAAGSLAGKIVLVDRGTCNFSDKIRNVALGGGLVGVIGLIAAGEPFEGAFGGGPAITIPSYMVHLSTANAIRAGLAVGVVARFDPAIGVPLISSMVGGSARGPSYTFNSIKPEIGAPGASVSAQAGTGNVGTPFGGTSGATPMVAGSAALLLDAQPNRSPLDVKALLVNTADTNIFINPATQPGVLAPITRIGGGEVRVDRAAASKVAAWDHFTRVPTVSFGYSALTRPRTIQRWVEVRNYGGARRTYSITPSFRYATDEASGAVVIDAPSSVTVRGHSTTKFRVELTTDPSKLPIWTLNGGQRGGDGFRLQEFEFDGLITLSDGKDNIHLPWHVLPHRAAEVFPFWPIVFLKGGTGSSTLYHIDGTIPARVDAFSLLGTSGRIPRSELPGPGDNFAIVDLKYVGARLAASGIIQFAINTHGTRAHPNYPAEFDVYIDRDRDGTFDFAVFNLELTGFNLTGQNVVAVANLATGTATAFFFTDADLNSGNAILTAPLGPMGLTDASTFDFAVYAFDNYFTGDLTDAIEGLTYTPGIPRYVASGVPAGGVPVDGSSVLTIDAVPGGDVASPSQSGILLLYRDAKTYREADAIRVIELKLPPWAHGSGS